MTWETYFIFIYIYINIHIYVHMYTCKYIFEEEVLHTCLAHFELLPGNTVHELKQGPYDHPKPLQSLILCCFHCDLFSAIVALFTGGGERIQHPPKRAVQGAAERGEAVGGEGSAGGGAAETAGKHGGEEQPPQRPDGCRGGGAAAAQIKWRGEQRNWAEVRYNQLIRKLHLQTISYEGMLQTLENSHGKLYASSLLLWLIKSSLSYNIQVTKYESYYSCSPHFPTNAFFSGAQSWRRRLPHWSKRFINWMTCWRVNKEKSATWSSRYAQAKVDAFRKVNVSLPKLIYMSS